MRSFEATRERFHQPTRGSFHRFLLSVFYSYLCLLILHFLRFLPLCSSPSLVRVFLLLVFIYLSFVTNSFVFHFTLMPFYCPFIASLLFYSCLNPTGCFFSTPYSLHPHFHSILRFDPFFFLSVLHLFSLDTNSDHFANVLLWLISNFVFCINHFISPDFMFSVCFPIYACTSWIDEWRLLSQLLWYLHLILLFG